MDLEFGVTVMDISEKESENLIDKMKEQSVVTTTAEGWPYVELEYSTIEDDYTPTLRPYHHDPDDHVVFHAASDRTGRKQKGTLRISQSYYVPTQRPRDRLSFTYSFDRFIEVLSLISELKSEVERFTDKEVAAGPIETRH